MTPTHQTFPSEPLEGSAPKPAGQSPRRAIRTGVSAIAILFGICWSCSSGTGTQTIGPFVFSLTSTTAPAYLGQYYEVYLPIVLPVRAPTAAQVSALPAMVPFTHAPFFTSSDASFSLRVTVSYTDHASTPLAPELLIDPSNEFVFYQPGFSVNNDGAVLLNPSGYDVPILLEPMSRLQMLITSDQINYMMKGLAITQNVIVNPGSASPNTIIARAFDEGNMATTQDPITAPYVPAAIPGLTGFNLGLRLSAIDQAAPNIGVEVFVDITDFSNGANIVPAGQSGKTIGISTTSLSPPGDIYE